jgi:phospholipid/cholesterol/gamma-HCH transport system substrate-binding protein
VDKISIINDSNVRVGMLIRKSVKQFIKSDSEVAIGSDGMIGDRILIITQGSTNSPLAKSGALLTSLEPTETDAIVKSLAVTAENAEIITDQLAEIMVKINSGEGTLGRLIQDSIIAENLSQTMKNLKSSSKGLDENMKAAQDNFLLKGYFKKKEKREKQKQDAN